MNTRIMSRHFTMDQKLETYIQKKVEKLKKVFDRITTVEVALDLEDTGRIKDKIVEMRVKVPGKLLIHRSTAKKFEPAFDKSLKALKEQLKRYKGRRNG